MGGNSENPEIGDKGKSGPSPEDVEKIAKQLKSNFQKEINGGNLEEKKAKNIEELSPEELEEIKENFKKQCLTTEKAEISGYKGKNTYLTLPNGSKLGFFVSDDEDLKERVPDEVLEKCYSNDDIIKLIKAVDTCLKEKRGIKIIKDDDKILWRNVRIRTHFTDIMELKENYLLKDGYMFNREGISHNQFYRNLYLLLEISKV